MNGPTPPTPRRIRHLQATPATPELPAGADPIGALMVRQAREGFTPDAAQGPGAAGGERVTDLAEIARVLNNCLVASDESDDDLVFELLMLESMLSELPVRSNELLVELGALGDEVRDGLVPPGVVDIASLRRRTRRLRQHIGNLASRISAALVLFLTGTPLLTQDAHAAGEDAKGVAVANAPVVRVIDAVSFQAVPGVQIKTMDERLLGVTDASGNAVLGDGYLETDLLSLERDGYDMYLLDRSQLSSRNIVSMKPLKGAALVAAGAGARGAAPVAGRPSAPEPASFRPPAPPKAPEPPRVAHGASGHEAHVTPPRPPAKPAIPSIKLPVRPRGKAAEPVHAAPHGAAPHSAASHGAGHGADASAPHIQLPKAPARLASAASHGGAHAAADSHGGDAHAVAKPGKAVRLPVRPRTHGAAEGHHAAAGSHAAAEPHLAAKPTLGGDHAEGAGHAAPHSAAAAPGGHHGQAASAGHAKHHGHAGSAGHAKRHGEATGLGHGTHHAKAMPAAHGAHAGQGHGGRHVAAAHGAISSPVLPRRPRGLHGTRAAHHAAEAPHVAIPHQLPAPRLSQQAWSGGGAGEYRVRPGDSLSAIAQRMMGSARRWPELYAANRDRVANPAKIRAGQVLSMPRVAVRQGGNRAYYRVKPGDCLYTIASSQLGNGSRWQSIWAMNRTKVRDARRIFPGQVLSLPEA
ncbi:MAG: LysM peptidoglycan-binding domain-containing protein [Candidatus Sericytochromatia bacterium]|nr:LysM peptidoglycan-binding domain-containing protein [Candidatus Sericytochromatia bacterium]